MRILAITIIVLVLFSACANVPEFDKTGVNLSLTPVNVTATMDTAKDQKVIWGGVVLSSENLKDATQIEMLAYPMDSGFLPQLEQEPIGRFIIHHPGYLETTMFQAGRMVSVQGVITGSRTGKVGEAEYIYPLVNSNQLHLWSRDSGRGRTTFHFGLGVQL